MPSGRDDWRALRYYLGRETRRAAKVIRDGLNAAETNDNEDPGAGLKRLHAMVEKTHQFEYENLPANHIRLLQLLPAESRNDPVLCTLSTVSLEESPGTYQALSYVWGDPDQPKQYIIINDRAMLIYETLLGILAQLRHKTNPIVLWVDAICINQDDMEERNVQIPVMRNVYRSASKTVAWLGDEDNGIQETFELLTELVQEAKSDPWVKYYASATTRDTLAILALLPNHTNAAQPPSDVLKKYGGDANIFDLIHCPWWQRAWTVQELLLSPSAVLVRGGFEMDWAMVSAAVDHGLTIGLWSVWNEGSSLNRAFVPYCSIKALEERRRLQLDHPRTHAVSAAEYLLFLLMRCRHRAARDPRDKIFSLLGLFEENQKVSKEENSLEMAANPDYGKPVVYIYRVMSQQLIEQTGTLDVVGVCPRSPRRGLPSWVADWSITTSTTLPLMRDSISRPRTTHASRHSRAKPEFPDDAVTMTLRAQKLTTVAEISDVLRQSHLVVEMSGLEEEDEPLWQTAKDVYREFSEETRDEAAYWFTILAWKTFAARRQPANPGTRPDWVFWQTLCAGTYLEGDVAKTEVLYRKWLECVEVVRRYKSLGSKAVTMLIPFSSSSWDKYPEFGCYMDCAHQRRLGWAAAGWLCLLPEGTEVGDSVILAEGGRVPLVIRPDGDGYNQLIGEAYIEGIMDGEVYDAEKCRDVKIC
ncbi:hypothetical protein S40288_08937 [Stachybotrys chartarum IBT 40288]|nr:hypothetical protein S40288_08937 [Stachybotrys chartarum IBT 40288]